MLIRLSQAGFVDSLLRELAPARDKWNLRCTHFPRRICARVYPTAIIISSIQTSFCATLAARRVRPTSTSIGSLTQAAVTKRRVWVSSLLFAQLAPSMFVPGRFGTLQELARYIRSLVTLVTPDPNTMLRVARLRDAKWQRPAGVRGTDEKPRMMSFSDAVQIASALWVKEAGGVPDLKFLMFDDWSSNEADGRASLAAAPSGLRRRCAGQFGCDGGREIDACPTSSPGAFPPTNSASRIRALRRLLRAAR